MNITVTLIAQMLAFILLIWFVNKVMWKPMMGLMEARQKRIADGLAAAEKGKQEQADAARKELRLEIERERSKAQERAAQQRKELDLEVEPARER